MSAGGAAPSIDADRLVALATELVATPSVNPFGSVASSGEAACGAILAERLRAAGAAVQIEEIAPGRTNVFGHIAGRSAGPVLMLAGHTDTVGVEGYVDPFTPVVAGGRLRGRGSCDMKGGLAAIVEAVTTVAGTGGPQSDVVVAALCDEEYEMLGSRAVASGGPGADMAIVAEPTSLAICPAHKGQLGVLIRTAGHAVHSSRPELGVNAIDEMTDVLVRLRAYDAVLREAPAHALCGNARFNVGVITGGTIASIVPSVCEVELDRRTLPGETFDSVVAELEALLEPLGDRGIEITGPTWDIPWLDTPVDAAIVDLAAAAHLAATGENATVEAFPAATDAPNLGCPAVVYGPGDLAVAHSLDESIAIDQLTAAAATYVSAMLDVGA
jgi:acetylornithine deacetylase/succinyl-diaminopimelate desuccinylase-like protein